MTDEITCGDIVFNIIGLNNRIDFRCDRNGVGQCILTIDRIPKQLYIWYDEGRFPKCMDTVFDNNAHRKLIITGVDEL